MEERQKFVVIVFPDGLQGKIWSAILRSQALSVIWESPDVPIPHTLKTLCRNGSLPDLLIVDTRLHHLQPFRLCRWCHDNCPKTKVLLVNVNQPRILAAERQWAIAQGAADLLPGISKSALISSAASNLRKVLDLVKTVPYNRKTFIAAMLKIRITPQSPSSFHERLKLYIDAQESNHQKNHKKSNHKKKV